MSMHYRCNSVGSHECPRRNGHTLFEMIVAAGSASLLLAGMAAALGIANKALLPSSSASIDAGRADLVLEKMTTELQHALSFTERSATAVTCTVPDRNGDASPETIRYSWSGLAGDPLLYQFNEDAPTVMAANVQQFHVAGLTRLLTAEPVPIFDTIIYEAFAENKAVSDLTTLAIPTPTGTAAGRLLIAAIAVDGGVAATLASPAEWTPLVAQNNGSQVTLGVWWKWASAGEPASHTFTWTGGQRAYGWIMRFRGAAATGPINALSTTTGTSAAPATPTVTTTVGNALVIRIGAFDDHRVNIDNAGISGYTTITADESDTSGGAASGAAAYAMQTNAGSTGITSFALTGSQEYVTCTIAIAPNPL